MSHKKLKVYLEGDARSAEKAFDSVTSKADKLKSVLGTAFKVGAAAAGAAAVAFTAGMKSCVNAAAEEEQAVNMLAQAMQHHGTYTAEALEEMKAFASEQQRLTTYGDETTIAMLQQLQTFGMNTEEMKAAARAAQDLAAAKGIDLNAAAQLVGKAFAGNTGTMSRYGIVLDQTRLQAEGFTYVLEALEARFGGAAQAAAETYTGRVQQMKNAWGDLQETVGYAVLPALTDLSSTLTTVAQDLQESGTLEKMLDPLADAFGRLAPLAGDALTAIVDTIAGSDLLPAITEMFASALSAITPLLEQLGPPIAEIFGQLAGVGASLLSSLAPVIQALAPIVAKVIQLVAGFLEKAVPVIGQIAAKLGEIVSRILVAMEPYINRILEAVFGIIEAILPVLPALLDMLMPIVDVLLDLIPPLATVLEFVAKIAETIVGVLAGALEWVAGAIGSFAGIWSSVWDAVKGVFGAVWDGIRWIYDNTIAPVVNALKNIWEGLQSVWESAWNGLKNVVKGGLLTILKIGKEAAHALDCVNILSGDPILEGPIINAIAAVENWHKGGWIPGMGEIALPFGLFEGGEFVIPKDAAAKIGPAGLEAIRQGRVPAAGGDGATYHIHFHIGGFFGSQRELDGLARKLVTEHIPRVTFATGGAK